MPRPDREAVRVAAFALTAARHGGTPAKQVVARFAEERRRDPRLTAAEFFSVSDADIEAVVPAGDPRSADIETADPDVLIGVILNRLPSMPRGLLEQLSVAQLREFVKGLPALAHDAAEARAADAELGPALTAAGTQKFSETFFSTWAVKGRKAALDLLPPHRRARCPKS